MSNARLTILQARAVKDKKVSDAQFRTLAALGMYADEDGWCFPKLATLGKDLGKSKQAVGRDTIALRKLGYLEVRARFEKDGSRRSNLYRLKYDLPPVNMDDSTPSTPEVDTPSTPEVDVNVPSNDPKKKKILSSADKTVDGILAFEKKAQEATQSGYWQGRENTPSHLLKYADWWNSKTGQEMKGKVRADWFKEFTRWNEEQVSLSALEEAFEHVKGWKRIVSKPSDVTNDAIAINALPKPNKPEAAITQEGGFYV